MTNSLIIFNRNIEATCVLENIFIYLEPKIQALDMSEILRAEYVLIVSAFDYYIHDRIRDGMLQIFDGLSPVNDKYNNFHISLNTVTRIISETDPLNRNAILDLEIRKITSKDSYQSPASIEQALGLISIKSIWTKVSGSLLIPPEDIKKKLNLIVRRRNKIAHEADYDCITNSKTPIEIIDVEDTRNFIVSLVNTIDLIT